MFLKKIKGQIKFSRKIKTEDIKLKILQRKNLSLKYLKWINDKKVMRFTSFYRKKSTIKDLSDFYNNIKKSKNQILYGIFIKNLHIGNCKLGPINFKKKTAEISYLIGEKKYWGRGIGKIAVNKLCKKGKNLSIKNIYASTDKSNKYSILLLLRNNFKRTTYNPHKVVLNKNDVLYHKVL